MPGPATLSLRLILLAAALLPGLARAQSPPAPEAEQTFFESIDVNVVNVEVYVTDKEGRRVQDLTRDDFQVLEDGKPVEITNFYAVSDGQVSQAAPPAGETEEAAEAPAAAAAPEDQRLYLAIFLDNRSLIPSTRNQILKSVKEFVARLRPEDRILIAAYDGSVQVRQGLTSDPAALAAALEEMAKVAPGGVARNSERRRLLAEIDAAYPVGGPVGGENQRDQVAIVLAEQLYNNIKQYGMQVSEENRAALAQLEEFVDSLAGLPGRKALLYVSGGFVLRPIESFMRAWEQKFAVLAAQVGYSPFDGTRDDMTPKLQELIEHANSNRITFYSLGSTPELVGVSAESGASDMYDSNMEAMDRTARQSTLLMIAGGTGGLASVDAAATPMLDRMRQDFDTYYSLGYVPQKKRDGSRRKVEVKVRGGRSLVVRHREAHRERTLPERMTSRTMSALLLGEEDNPLEVALELGKEKRNDKGQYEVEVLVKFPLANLVLVPQDKFHEGKLSLFVGARDSHGRSSPIQQIAVPIRVPNDQLLTALGQVGAYRMTMLLRPEPHTVAVAVRDELGNADSTARADYTPGQQEEAAPEEAAPGR